MTNTFLNLSIDLGASVSKGIYTIYDDSGRAETYGLLMNPEVAKIPKTFVENEVFESEAMPESNSWIGQARSKEVTAVGLLAKKFESVKQIDSVKYENALHKCLAAVGVVIAKHSLDPINIQVGISLLIPYDEYESRLVIEKSLTTKIKRFYFRQILVKGKLVSFNCYPEGLGGFFNRISSFEENWIANKTVAILMLGHRNCSCLIMEKGAFKEADTIRLGYFDYLKDIQGKSIGQKISDLEYMIPQLNQHELDSATAERFFGSLVKANGTSNQSKEINKIREAVIDSRKKFWYRLSSWIDTKIPMYLDEVQIFGGTSHCFIKKKLVKNFSWVNTYWGCDIVDEIKKQSYMKFWQEEELPSRFIDVYGIHQQHNQIG